MLIGIHSFINESIGDLSPIVIISEKRFQGRQVFQAH